MNKLKNRNLKTENSLILPKAKGSKTHLPVLLAFIIFASFIYIFSSVFIPGSLASGSGGSVDTTFGTGGIVITAVGNEEDVANDVVVQPDGKIIAGGYTQTVANNTSSRNFALVRYNADGSLDQTFGTGGRVTTDFNSGQDEINALALQTDGKIIAAGLGRDPSGLLIIAIARYNSNGTLDTTFDSDGKVEALFGTGSGFAHDVVIDSSNRIIVAGSSLAQNGFSAFAAARFTSNGSPDTSFGTNGAVLIPVAQFGNDDANALAIDSSGRIVLAGNTNTGSQSGDFAFARINSNGSIDTNFGTNGTATVDFDDFDEAFDVIVQANGAIVGVGYAIHRADSTSTFALARLTSSGAIDSSFDSDGKVITNFGAAQDVANSAVIQSDGRIIAIGQGGQPNQSMFALARYNSNGSLDQTFGTGGLVLTDINDLNAATSAAIQPDGKLVAAGFTNVGSIFAFDFALVRYNLSSSIRNDISDFDGDGRTDISVFRPSDTIWYRRYSSDNSVQYTQFGLATDVIMPGDYDGDGRTDIAVYRPSEGNWYLLQSSNGFTAVNFGLNNDIPVARDFDGDGRTDIAVYRPSNGTWYLLQSTAGFAALQFGVSTDLPVPNDYDGDGRADLAVYRPSNGTWFLLQSTAGFTATQFGINTDQPTQGDYDGDGRADLAVYRPSSGTWYLQQTTAGFKAVQFGINTDQPVPGDYDGDGRTDIAVYRPNGGIWYLWQSTNGIRIEAFGTTGDIPTPSAYIP